MTRIQLRRGTAAEWAAAAPVLASGEPGFETDNGGLRIGDGSSAWASLTALASKGDVAINVADYSSLAAAVAAAPNGAVLYLPAGTYPVTSLTVSAGKSLTFVGDNPDTSIINAPGAYGFIGASAGGVPAKYTFRNIGFTGASSACISVARTSVEQVRLFDCRFTGFTDGGIETFGTNLLVSRCTFTSDGTPGTKTAIRHYRGAQSIIVDKCNFRYLYRGIYLSDTDGAARNVSVTGCTFDGGYMYLKSAATNSGGTVTYAATTLTDSAASFPTYPVYTAVRAMGTKQAGTVTAISNTKVTDSAAGFIANGVRKGDILRTSTKWAVVDSVVSATIVQVEEWLNLSDYTPAAPPATTTAYTVYGLVLGRLISNTATQLTVGAWINWDGTIATPANGTLYEVALRPDYQGLFAFHVDKLRVTNNTFRRSWADQMSIQAVDDAVIANNHVYDGQDVGITVGQPSGDTSNAIVANNRVRHQGFGGIWCGFVTTAKIQGNNISDTNWMSPVAAGDYCGITVNTGSDVDISNNTIKRTTGNHATMTRGIHLLGTTSNVYVNNNVTVNLTEDFVLTGASVTGVQGKFQAGTVVLLVTSAPPPRGSFAGAGSPEGVLAAAVGSEYLRASSTGATLYVKETGTGNTGWVPQGVGTDTLAAGESAMPRELAMSAAVTMTSGTMRLSYFTARKTETITSVRIISGTTAATATPTLVRVGIYSQAANGDLTLVASTANDTALLAGTSTVYTKALQASWAKVAGQRYAFGILVVSGVAMPTLTGYAYQTSITSEIFQAPMTCSAVASLSDLPSPTIANALQLNSGNRIYGAVVP